MNMNLLTIAKAIEGKLYCDKEYCLRNIEGAVIDSRLVKENYLFFAVKGEKVDGHDFIDKVYKDGALVVVSEKELNTNKPYILVKSSLNALKLLAKYYRSTLNIPVIGISGSVGKTSTKEFIAGVLATKFNVLKTEGNFNNEIGLPLTILKIREYHEVAVIEMGISDFGEMTRLSSIAVPDICIITNIGICHLENLKDRDGVLRAKTEMFANAKPNAKIFLNGDDDKLSSFKLNDNRTISYFGIDNKYDAFASDIVNEGIDGSCFTLHIYDETAKVHVPIPGTHMVINAVAASLVGYSLGLNINDIKKGIENIQSVGGRVNVIKKNYTIIDDCYNANPVSMKASLDLLSSTKGRKIAVIGDMFELGDNENALHEEIGNYVGNLPIDYVFVTGKFKEHIKNGFIKGSSCKNNVFMFDNNDELIYNIKKFVKDKDIILIKASHSMHFENIVKALNE